MRGRPTKYSPDVLNKLSEYLSTESMLATKEGFARFIGVNSDSIHEWERVHKEFSVAIKMLTDQQKTDLINNGLIQKYNPTMAIFLLKVNHGMVETEKRILAGDKENPLVPHPIYGGKSAT